MDGRRSRFQMGGRSCDRCQMGMAARYRFHWERGTVLGRIERCMGLGQGGLNRLGREDRLVLSLVDLEYWSGLRYRL
jgi:hypothetical protein